MLVTWTLSERRVEAVDDLEAVARHVRRRLQARGIRSTLIATPEGAYQIRVDTTSPLNPLFRYMARYSTRAVRTGDVGDTH